MRDKIMRVDRDFSEEINKIARKRIENGIDKKFRSSRRLTLAMLRHPLLRQIELDIIKADLDAEGRK